MSKKIKKSSYARSRFWQASIIVVFLLVCVAFIWLDRGLILRKLRRQPQTSEQARTRNDIEKYHAKTFTVINIVDGDTIDIDIADGQYEHTRIRLWGVDAPETKNPKTEPMYFGPQATGFTKGLALGKKITVYLDKGNRSRGKYGRLLAYVQLPDGRFLNEVLLAEGFAYADLRFSHSFYNKYKQLEASARSGKKGLWANVTREQLPEWLQRMRPKLLEKEKVE